MRNNDDDDGDDTRENNLTSGKMGDGLQNGARVKMRREQSVKSCLENA